MPHQRVGTAAWSIPAQVKEAFPGEGQQLARYARVLNAVEINSSFYRDHKPETYAKWAGMVPEDFRFAVKLSRYFTQETRLTETGARLTEVLAGISELGPRWEVLLVQLPPSLRFDRADAHRFLSALRKQFKGEIAWEPRHLSWASDAAVRLLADHRVAKVIADPEKCPWSEDQEEIQARAAPLRYYRLHGSPEIYRSRYTPEFVKRIAEAMDRDREARRSAWCVFDNTTFGFATENALELREILGLSGEARSSRQQVA